MAIVKDLLKEKGSAVWSVTPQTPLKIALELMAEKKIGAVVVMDGDKVIGIFSERDFARYAAIPHQVSLDTPVGEIMTREVYVITPDKSVDECMALMTARRFRHLPVMDKDRIIGVISIGDVVKQVISERDIQIKALENYILGRGYNQ